MNWYISGLFYFSNVCGPIQQGLICVDYKPFTYGTLHVAYAYSLEMLLKLETLVAKGEEDRSPLVEIVLRY